MKKLLILTFCFSFTLTIFGQNEKKLSFYIGLYRNWSIYDAKYSTNGNGIGLNIDSYLNTKSRIKAKLEVNGNMFNNYDLYIVDLEGHHTPDKSGTACVFFGPAYNLSDKIEVSFNVGPCFIQSDLYLGLKPCVILYPGTKKIFKLELSLTNIFQPDAIGGGPFGFISFGIGVRLH